MIWDDKGNISHSLKRDSIRREVENSLRRLRVDAIDLYQIHWPNPDAQIEEGWSTLADLKREGKVRYIGVSNFNVYQMQRAMAIAPIDSLPRLCWSCSPSAGAPGRPRVPTALTPQ
jgi:aryl-alcohol dehydrogenase-like predicted oxidoreductase